MITKYYILILSLILYSCANPSNNSSFAEANTNHEVAVEEKEDTTSDDESESDSMVSTKQVSDLQSEDQAIAKIETPVSQNAPDHTETKIKRKASTIAEQQEAARKIQQELEARNPKPNEAKNLENAVFEKVVKKAEPKKAKPKAPTKKKKTKGWPAIEFAEMKMVFDTISEGDIIKHDFIFTNTGSAPLEIKTVSVTCGCTRPSYPFIPIEPNEQGRISVTYNSVGKEGFQNPEITVNTNISSKEIVLKMEGFVVIPDKEEESKH